MDLLEFTFSYLWDADTYEATVLTDGTVTSLVSVKDEAGNVINSKDWDMINMVELLSVCLWMDEQATYYLSTEVH